jgi:nucleotide sugar dehydrogenase
MQILNSDQIKVIAYDKDPKMCDPINTTWDDILACDIIFISVPTPMNKDGSVYTNIVESVVQSINKSNSSAFIVVRSTVPPGTCDKLGVFFMPEFLTEKNSMNDFINNEQWIFGIPENISEEEDIQFRITINKIIKLSYDDDKIKCNNIYFVNNKEAEMVKYFRNTFLATKVSFCNEIAEFREKKDINYNVVSELACSDKRIGLSHTKVPGHDGRKGFGGTCFPKDTAGLLYEMQNIGMKSYVLEGAVERNNNVDRPEKDWCADKGRAVV